MSNDSTGSVCNTSHHIFCFTSSLLIIQFLVSVGSQHTETKKKSKWLGAGLFDCNFNLLRSITATLFNSRIIQLFKLFSYLWASRMK